MSYDNFQIIDFSIFEKTIKFLFESSMTQYIIILIMNIFAL